MNRDSNIIIFGARGLLGSAIHRLLKNQEYTNLYTPTRQEVNLLNLEEIKNYFINIKPDFIFMTAGLVGGVLDNSKRGADYLYQNTLMILNLLEAIKEINPKIKILYTGSTCIYPKENPQPISENRFLAGKLEETNKGYAISKITGIVACQLYRKQYGINAISVMPTNLYGFNDSYDLLKGHMLASILKKIYLAKTKNKEVVLWGSGNPRREALFSDDCADAIIHLMNNYSSKEIVNIGTGFDYSIKEIAEIIKKEIDWNGVIYWDKTKPDGVFEKRTDITNLLKIYPNFKPRTFNEGIRLILNNPDEIKRMVENEN